MNMSASTAAARASLPYPIVLLGRDDSGKAHASYFSATDGHSAKKAAGLMGMVTLRADTDDIRALMAKIPKGKLFDSGKAFVPFVKQALFKQLAAHLPEEERMIADRPRSATSETVVASEANGGGQAQAPVKPSQLAEDWSKLKIGNLVLATEGPMEGWFEATIIEIKSNGALRLKWRDYLDTPPFDRPIAQVAMLHPKYVEA
ncbi:hypothetical protein HGP17_18845 [Rhizobium sp. P38BS-XIX]|uniref:hypothetical protein n=1 Tax=Rhizobium sp. P38BS-XIX TaxID=2726740 RepID=UPI00145689A1|nr:hypothetical protein [Rhizobium sp. P38BS-XIX]NLR98880.1 hypothetical protein [Rhizobium sp. P38BS-XIX]